ncbi:hypothetical protein ETB97_000596 [Aspergillus alliaceus]|uniref:Uncharacterized protein n=1 Tax=Petromyces alliaceus TaxID=209559 RepID=A0A5N6G4X9_PETAA|nr:uncharacterized protein BDW43DRAFT_307852 [Aspergillus alliaceus]KAB8236837.1 hypothetical protein BDW43DRAFT_307852 [Aspergillus alliaceus]KAF5861156.1 hypothetical protein ETB97_000596 [Aspergillus burnettii]
MADVDNLITLVRQKQKTNVQDVAMVFDALPPIEPECLLGVWSGDLVETGHKDIKVIRDLNWAGKTVHTIDDVDLVIFSDENGASKPDMRWDKA